MTWAEFIILELLILMPVVWLVGMWNGIYIERWWRGK